MKRGSWKKATKGETSEEAMVQRVLDLELLNTRLIRERQEAEDLGEYLRRILDELPHMVVVRRTDGEVLFANRAAEIAHGEELARLGALAGHHRLEPAPEDGPGDLGGLGEALGGADPEAGEGDELVEFVDAQGSERILYVRERPFPLGAGDMAVLQLGWDAEEYVPPAPVAVPGSVATSDDDDEDEEEDEDEDEDEDAEEDAEEDPEEDADRDADGDADGDADEDPEEDDDEDDGEDGGQEDAEDADEADEAEDEATGEGDDGGGDPEEAEDVDESEGDDGGGDSEEAEDVGEGDDEAEGGDPEEAEDVGEDGDVEEAAGAAPDSEALTLEDVLEGLEQEQAAAEAAAEPEEVEEERLEGDLDGDGKVDEADDALADALAGLEEEAAAHADAIAEPGIVEDPEVDLVDPDFLGPEAILAGEPAGQEPSDPVPDPEPLVQARGEGEGEAEGEADSGPAPDPGELGPDDVVYDPLAEALREPSDPPPAPDGATHSAFADEAVTLSQIGLQFDEDGSPVVMSPEDLDPLEQEWEDPEARPTAALPGAEDEAGSEVDIDTLSSIFLRADMDDEPGSGVGDAEPLIGPASEISEVEGDDRVDVEEPTDPGAVVAPEEGSLVFEAGAVAPADPTDGPENPELAAAMEAFEAAGDLVQPDLTYPPAPPPDEGTLSRIFEEGDGSGESIEGALGEWGLEASEALAEAGEPAGADPADEVAAALAEELGEEVPEAPVPEAEPIPTTPEEEAMRRAFEDAWETEDMDVHSFVSASQIQDAPEGPEVEDLHEVLTAEDDGGLPEAPDEGPPEDLEPVEDLRAEEVPEPAPLEEVPEVPSDAPTVVGAETAARLATQGYAVGPVRELTVGEAGPSGSWNLVTEPWTPEEATRVCEQIVAEYEAQQEAGVPPDDEISLVDLPEPELEPVPLPSQRAADATERPIPNVPTIQCEEPPREAYDADGQPVDQGLISRIVQLKKGQTLRPEDLEPPPRASEPVFAVPDDTPDVPDAGRDWLEVEQKLESMPEVSIPEAPQGSVPVPDWAAQEEPEELPEEARDDPMETLAQALRDDAEAGEHPPASAPPPRPQEAIGEEGPDWEAELRAQMEAGELGDRPAKARPLADDTERALWEVANEEAEGVRKRMEHLERQLNAATRRAEAAERALEEARREKADVLAYTGNELRTPLEGILGMAELLRGTELDGEQRDMLGSLIQNAQLLYSLLRGIIETASLGSETANQDAVDLFEIVRGVVDELAGLADAREVVLLRSIQAGVPQMVEGDGERVRVLLRNLIETTLRFLEKGEMELVVSMEGALPSGPMLRFTIHDTGAGLPPELLALLDGTPLPPGFEEATGLGGTARVLSASQEMAVGMDGSIQAETITGQGAQLFLIMPFRWARRDADQGGLQIAPGEDESLKAATGRVLLVEDNPIARKVTAAMLEQLGRAPELAESGEQAVHQVQRNHYGLILLDTDLPDMGWSEVTRLIRAAEVQANRRSVLLGLVPHNGPALELCVSEGMDGVLDKPVELKYLQDTLERFLGSDFMRVRVRDEPPTSSDANRFDPAFLTKQFPSDHRAAYEVLEVFLMDADQLETKLIHCIRKEDWDQVREIGHSLKGVARNVGAARLAALAEDMEAAAASGDAAGAEGVAGDVTAELAWLRGELAA